MSAHETDDAQLLATLDRRSQGVTVGEKAQLADLQARDPHGAPAFSALARRFGWAEDGAGAWQRERIPRWTPGWVEQRHEQQWLDLFELAFGYRMAQALWRWKYRHNPLAGMGAWRGGQLVAFYGAMTREVLFMGKSELTVQIGDVMTRPDERGVMTRAGPFQLAASTFIERSVGYGKRYLFGFGFPTEKALLVAQKLGLYQQVDKIVELSWAAQDSLAARLDRSDPLRLEHRHTVDALWEKMARRLKTSVVGVRDWNYISDRFLGHPVNRYQCLLVSQRFTRRPKGVVVLRDQGAAGLEILDLIGDPDEWADLVRFAQRHTALHKQRRAFLWLTESHVHWLAGSSPQQAPLELTVPANVWTPGPSAQELSGRWWLTAGDMDFR